jgi:hypothetical protein
MASIIVNLTPAKRRNRKVKWLALLCQLALMFSYTANAAAQYESELRRTIPSTADPRA